jgi:CRISPR/Cas system type I-B associated protein Csh2 (Cas7 group RAMP superfamily)
MEERVFNMISMVLSLQTTKQPHIYSLINYKKTMKLKGLTDRLPNQMQSKILSLWIENDICEVWMDVSRINR